MTFVASLGPPEVITYIKSKTWKDEIAVTRITKYVVGLRSGSVIFLKISTIWRYGKNNEKVLWNYEKD